MAIQLKIEIFCTCLDLAKGKDRNVIGYNDGKEILLMEISSLEK